MVSGKVTASATNGGENGHHDSSHYNGRSNGYLKSSSDFNKVSSLLEETTVTDYNAKVRSDVYSESNDLRSLTRRSKKKSPPAVAPKPQSGIIHRGSDLGPAVLASSLRDDSRRSFKAEPSKEFGEFSILTAPALLKKKNDANNNGETTTTTRTETTETRQVP